MTETAADEQDLAKALDSVANAASSLDGSTPSSDDSSDDAKKDDEDNGIPDLPPIVPLDSPVAPPLAPPLFPSITPAHDSNDSNPSPVQHPSITPAPALDDTQVHADDSDDDTPSAPVEDGPLADIKKDALDELRPLVDKLNVSAEEKFDTYLLLIRSTDDKNLIGPAHEAAKSIKDEARKAEALLEIIKEIDYLSRQSPKES